MDRERADFHQALKEIREVLEVQAVPLLLPIGREAGFKGVVDLISQKAYPAPAGGKLEAGPIPDDLKDEVEALRGDLLNFAAESDDALIEKFLEEGELTPEEIYQGLRRSATLKGSFRAGSVRGLANQPGQRLSSCWTPSISISPPRRTGARSRAAIPARAQKWLWSRTRMAPWRPRSSRPWPTPTPAACPSSASTPAP